MQTRTMKFRAFDTLTKSLWAGHSISIDANGDVSFLDTDGIWKPNENDRIIVTQFTGLVDMNQKDIFEGDILNWGKRMYEVVINFNGFYLQAYRLFRGQFKPAFRYGMSLIAKPLTVDNNITIEGFVESAEVIGNVFENFELLTK